MVFGRNLGVLGVVSMMLFSAQAQAQTVFDRDGDGWNRFLDCNDRNDTIYPGADEILNGIDEDCDGLIDEDFLQITLTSPADGTVVGLNGVLFQAVVRDDLAVDELSYSITSSAGAVELVSMTAIAGAATVEIVANLPCGNQVVSVTVETPDGLEVDTDTVEIEADAAPVAAITSPSDGDIFGDGFSVDLQGITSDACQDPAQLEVTWLDNGQLVANDFADADGTSSTVLEGLTVGEHIITLGVQDPNGNIDSDTVTITIMEGETCSETDDMVLHWDFEEGGGISLLDTSGSGNFGEVFGEPVWVDGMNATMGQALELDGLDDFAVAGHSASLNATDEVTVMMWVRVSSFPPINDDYPKNWFPVLSKGEAKNYQTDRNYSMYVASNQSTHFSLSLPDGSGTTNPTESNGGVTAGSWTHIAGRATINSGGTVAYFIDGQRNRVFTQRGNTALLPNSQPLYLGKTLESNPNFFGTVDDVRVYPCGLSDVQIEAIFDSANP